MFWICICFFYNIRKKKSKMKRKINAKKISPHERISNNDLFIYCLFCKVKVL